MANGLLGLFQPQPNEFQTLLGEYYDPKTSRMKWLGGSLQGLGAGLASGRPGAWAQGLAMGGGEALEDYQRQALLGYQMAQRQEEQEYQRGREMKADAWTNTMNQRTLESDEGNFTKAPQTESVWNPATGRYERVQWVNGQWVPLTMPEGGGLNRHGVEEAPMEALGGDQYAPYPEEEADALNDPYSDDMNRAIAEAEASGQWPQQRQHPLLGQTIGRQDHGMLDHELDGMTGQVIRNRPVPGTDQYGEIMSGHPYEMAPSAPPAPMPQPRPDWGVPGTDEYYENRNGQPMSLAPISYTPQQEPPDMRRAPGRFGGGVPAFGQRQGFANTQAEAPAKAPEKMTEGQRRVKLLATQTATQEPVIMKNFDDLASLQNVAGANIPFGRILMTPEGKAGLDSIQNVIGNWLYLVSGATATDQEMDRRTSEVMPAFGDDETTLALKKARLQSYIDGMKEMAGIEGQDPAAQRRNQLKQKYNLED